MKVVSSDLGPIGTPVYLLSKPGLDTAILIPFRAPRPL